jgi:hypothetical protein
VVELTCLSCHQPHASAKGGLLVKTRDADRFYKLLNHIALNGIEIESVAPADDDVNSVYEYLIEQVRKTGKFQHIYRSGDRAAGDIPDLAVLRMKVEGFRQGSETKRAVTTVSGATSIKMGIRVLTRDGQVVTDLSVEGKVRLLGENLRATSDFAKKAAKLAHDNFVAAPAS